MGGKRLLNLESERERSKIFPVRPEAKNFTIGGCQDLAAVVEVEGS